MKEEIRLRDCGYRAVFPEALRFPEELRGVRALGDGRDPPALDHDPGGHSRGTALPEELRIDHGVGNCSRGRDKINELLYSAFPEPPEDRGAAGISGLREDFPDEAGAEGAGDEDVAAVRNPQSALRRFLQHPRVRSRGKSAGGISRLGEGRGGEEGAQKSGKARPTHRSSLTVPVYLESSDRSFVPVRKYFP